MFILSVLHDDSVYMTFQNVKLSTVHVYEEEVKMII